MKQKQNKTVWQVCHSKGVLDSAKGPFFSSQNPGSTLAENTLRLGIFMLGVVAAAQMLSFIQTTVVQPDLIPRIFGQNLVRESISLGYIGDYFGNSIPQAEASTLDEVQNALLVFSQERVLAAQTYRTQAQAVLTDVDYQAELVSQNYKQMEIQTGRGFTYEAKFRNTGQAAWTNSGGHYVALNVTDPAGRHSSFQHAFWNEYYYRPGKLLESIVEPGAVGTFRFALQAPSAPGEYLENFGLVAENLTWITGGYISIPITVVLPPPAYRAELAGQSHDELAMSPGEVTTFWADFENTGTATWSNTGNNFIALNVTDPAGRQSAFQNENWNEYYYRPTRLDTDTVAPGETGRFKFTLVAPLQPGEYSEAFGLVAENLTWMEGGVFNLPITVQKTTVDELPNEPEVRIGLYDTTNKVVLAADSDFRIINGAGRVLVSLSADTNVTVTYSNNKYTVKYGDTTKTSSSYIRLVPQSQQGIVEIVNYENHPAWNPDLNDNCFRGKVEVRYSDNTEKLWVINELPLEQYLRGVAEASNDESEDYLKALIIAERTYAQYHITTGTKHATENYTIDATYDQAYRGYNLELRSPNITECVGDTAGLMVTYDDEVVVTPYYSHSDGRTRSWEEVWSGGPYPWLQSVPDPASKGLDMLGHGVGMSALGAREMAEDGNSYEEILKYFYTGIELEKIY